jgi:hypothetical protein
MEVVINGQENTGGSNEVHFQTWYIKGLLGFILHVLPFSSITIKTVY